MNHDLSDTEQRVRAAFAASEHLTHDWVATPPAAPSEHIAAFAGARDRGWRRWQPPLFAATAVAAVAISTIVLTQRVGPGGAPAAAPHASTTSSSATPRTSSLSSPQRASNPTHPLIIRPGRTAQLGPPSPQVGVNYPFDLLTHCGIRATIFGGREWQAVHPQPEPVKLPDSHGITHYDGYTTGAALLTNPSTLKFTVHDTESTVNGQSYLFAPATGQQPVCA